MALRTAYPLGMPPVWHGMARTEKKIGGVVPILASDLAAGNQVALFRAPAGFTMTDFNIDLPALDSNGAPTLTVSLGTSTAPTLILNASTSGRAGGVGVMPAAGARGTKFTADTDIIMTFPAGAATAAAGSVVVYVGGFIDP